MLFSGNKGFCGNVAKRWTNEKQLPLYNASHPTEEAEAFVWTRLNHGARNESKRIWPDPAKQNHRYVVVDAAQLQKGLLDERQQKLRDFAANLGLCLDEERIMPKLLEVQETKIGQSLSTPGKAASGHFDRWRLPKNINISEHLMATVDGFADALRAFGYK
jgi:hypothetical protein